MLQVGLAGATAACRRGRSRRSRRSRRPARSSLPDFLARPGKAVPARRRSCGRSSIRPSICAPIDCRRRSTGAFQSSTAHSKRAIALLDAAPRQMRHQRLADAAAAECRPHEEVFEIDAVTAAEGREVEKPDREAGRLAVPFGDVAEQPRLRRKQRRGDLPPASASTSCGRFS